VVGIELGHLVEYYPFQIVFLTQTVIVVSHIDEHVVGYRDDTLSRVSVDTTEGTYLAHIECPHTGELEEHAMGGIVDALVVADEASVEAPFATTGIHLSASDEQLQVIPVEAEDDTVYR
jgi:hypothetical protein